MLQLLFPTFDLTQPTVELITQIYEMLKPTHSEAAFDFDYQPPLLNYEAIRGCYSNLHCGPILRLENAPSAKYLCFIDVSWQRMSGAYGMGDAADFQTWGITFLQRKYGHVLITPQTTLDKIRELIHHAEIIFEDDKAFSDQFYVLADSEDNARKFLGPTLREAITKLPLTDFSIEVIDDVMIVGDNKCVEPATAGEIASFLCGLSPLT